MSQATTEARYSALCAALATLTEERDHLRLAHPAHPCEIVLQADPEGPTVHLRAEAHTTRVRAHSGSDPGGTSDIDDHLSVDLTHGFRWDDVVFDDADDLAYHLYKHMLRRQRTVSGMEPT